MALLQQIIQLLTEPPGTVVFHLVTLFALQAIFALSLGQWRNNRSNRQAGQTAVSAAVIFLARLVLMLVGLVVSSDPDRATAVLPPLEQAVHALTAVFLIWALLPPYKKYPRLNTLLLIFTTILIGTIYLFFAQDWPAQAALNTVYNASAQASVWGIFQIVMLSIGIILLMTSAELRNSLHVVILAILLIASLVHFWNFPEIIPTQTNIAYWIRLAHLIAFPLWAVLTYQYGLSIRSRQGNWAPTHNLIPALNLFTQVIQSLQQDDILPYIIRLVRQMVNVVFVGVGVLEEGSEQTIDVSSYLSENATPHNWRLDLVDWPSFRLAFEQERGVELLPNGLGARQLYDLYDELQSGPFGAMLVQPLLAGKKRIGLLLLAKDKHEAEWSNQERTLIATIGSYVGQVLAHSQAYAAAQRGDTPLATVAQQQQLNTLTTERDKLRAELDRLRSQLLQSEAKAAQTRQQAYSLAATLEEMEREDRNEKIQALETEITTLRQSLEQAEETLAIAAASDGGLSPEWVMVTITRYSAQLEEAQALIQSLEGKLSRRERGPVDEVVMLLAEELRTPITSISGYTDLMLNEAVGNVSTQQREFLQRVRANSERIGTLLDQIIQLMRVAEPAPLPQVEQADVRTAVETAVSSLITQIRDSQLRLDLHVDDNLPQLPISPHALHQIVANLLDNACRSSGKSGHIGIRAEANAIYTPGSNGHQEKLEFIHLEVSDSGGGIPVADLSRAFMPQQHSHEPLISGLGDTGAGLAVTQSLIENNGGRIWVDTEPGVGSTFSVLFPLSANGHLNGSA